MLVHLVVLFTSAVLLAVAGIHAYWTAGGLWPARDEASLAELVVGTADHGMPGPFLCALVVAALLAAATLVLAGGGVISLPGDARLVDLGVWVVAGVFALRGAGGLLLPWIRPEMAGTPFARANHRFYSPLCLLLAVGCAVPGVL